MEDAPVRPRMAQWTVRPTTAADAAEILALHVASIRAFGPAAYDERQVDAWATKEHGPEGYPVSDDRKRMFVVETDDGLAGFGQLNLDDGASGDDAEVGAVYVHPDYARRGVGSTLLAKLEDVAREEGFVSVSLLASLNAVPFYERAGYERVEEATHATTGDVELTCVRMRKPL